MDLNCGTHRHTGSHRVRGFHAPPHRRSRTVDFQGIRDQWRNATGRCLVEADRAAVHSRLTVRSKDKTWTTDYLDLFKFQGGKIIELTEFADTALIKNMMSGPTDTGDLT